MAMTPQEVDDLRTIERICVSLADALKHYHEYAQAADAAGRLARNMRERAELYPSLEARVVQIEQAIRALDRRTQPRIDSTQLRTPPPLPPREPSNWRPIEPPPRLPPEQIEIDVHDVFDDAAEELRKEAGLGHPTSR